MKNIRRILYAGILAMTFLCATKKSDAQAISTHFFGENAWMPDTVGNANACTDPPCILNGKLHQHWNDIKQSSATIIRFGGTSPDKNMPTNYQYVRMIDSVRAKGMEPVIQVPFYNNRYSASQAAAIVNYINVVKGMHIKYWIIGNEPNLGYSYTTAAQIANYFRPFASAMKAVDPSILIVGPEIAWFDQTIMDGLTNPGGPDDITGKDAAGRYYVDVVSFHTYPFSGAQTRTQVVTKLTSANSLPDNLAHLNSRIAAANTFHNRTGTAALKTAITEANIAWQNNAGDDVSGLGTNSFIGGQFVSEMMSIALKNSVDFFNIWSVIEGNTPVSDIGYIDPSSSIKKPLFYHFKMMADNFKGNYANGTTNKPNVKAFGSKNSQEITVMILNEEQTGTYNYTVRLNTSPVTGTNPLKVNLDAGVAMEYADAVPSQSTVLLTFNASGTLIRKTTYSLNDALANLAPTITNLITTGISDNTAAPVDDNHFDVKVFPNPSAGSFTIELNKNNTSGKEYEVMIVNMIGQEVYLKKTTFTGRREPIDLDGVLAAGTYIVRVKQGDGVITKKIIVGS